MRVLVVDVGGTHVKVLVTGEKEHREFPSGPALTAEEMVARVRENVDGTAERGYLHCGPNGAGHFVKMAHPQAVSDPAPLALCTGFGDSALKFELRVFTRVDDAPSFLSDLAIAVHAALSAAKIEIPFPRRDVHILNGEAARIGQP